MDKKDKVERAIELPDGAEPNPYLAKNVVRRIASRRDGSVAPCFSTAGVRLAGRGHAAALWSAVGCAVAAAVAALALALYVGLAFGSGGTEEKKYAYSGESTVSWRIVNVEEYVEGNGLDVLYFSADQYYDTSAWLALDLETGEPVYLWQGCDFIDEYAEYDIVDLKIVWTEAGFDYFEGYTFRNEEEIADLSVQYTLGRVGGRNLIKSRFTVGSVDYYMTVETSEAVDGKLERYLHLLLQ